MILAITQVTDKNSCYRPLLRIINGLTHPALNELGMRLDDALAQLIAANTKDELHANDIVWEEYATYELDFEELNKIRYEVSHS